MDELRGGNTLSICEVPELFAESLKQRAGFASWRVNCDGDSMVPECVSDWSVYLLLIRGPSIFARRRCRSIVLSLAAIPAAAQQGGTEMADAHSTIDLSPV